MNIYIEDGQANREQFYIRAPNKREAARMHNRAERLKGMSTLVATNMKFIKSVKREPNEKLIDNLVKLPFCFTNPNKGFMDASQLIMKLWIQ